MFGIQEAFGVIGQINVSGAQINYPAFIEHCWAPCLVSSALHVTSHLFPQLPCETGIFSSPFLQIKKQANS